MQGNSVRGVKVCRDLSNNFNLHMFNALKPHESVIRLKYDASEVSSKRIRSGTHRDFLKEQGKRIQVYELQGDLMFATIEPFIRVFIQCESDVDAIIIDLRRVLSIDPRTCELLEKIITEAILKQNKMIYFTHSEGLRLLQTFFSLASRDDSLKAILEYKETDAALEACEDHLLASQFPQIESIPPTPLESFRVCQGLDASVLEFLMSILDVARFDSVTMILHHREASKSIYFITSGRVGVYIRGNTDQSLRIASISEGMFFGEIGVLDQQSRSADVLADEAVTCLCLNSEDFEQLSATRPQLKIKLLENLVQHFCGHLRAANEKVQILGS